MGYGKTYKTKWLEDLSGNQGTANQVLISTSAGIAWATASTVIGGPYLPLSGGTMTGNTTHGDNVRSLYGASSDMQIYHDGANSYVRDVGTGRLWIDSNGEGVSIISDGSGSTPMAHFYKDGAVELYHNNVRRFRTNDLGGVSIDHTSGSMGNSFFGAVSGATNGFQIANSSSNEMTYTFQNGSNSQVLKILNNGNVGIGTSSPGAKLDVAGTGNFTGLVSGITPVAAANFATKSYVDAHGGGTGPFLPLAGGTMTGNTIHNDGVKSFYGTGSDLQIFHDGSHSYIQDTSGTGDLRIDTNVFRLRSANGGESMIRAFEDGQVILSFNNIDKLATTSTGISVTGNGIFTGNVGIGTTSPSEKLEVDGNIKVIESGQTPDVSVFHSDGSYAKLKGQGLFLSRSTSYVAPEADNFGSLAVGYNGAKWGNVEINAATVKFENGANEFMRINSSGNVGIGTTSPDYQLEVEKTSAQATIGITGGATDARLHLKTNNGDWMLQNDYSNNGALSFYNSGHRLVVAKNGNVGIGTTNPGAKLQIGSATYAPNANLANNLLQIKSPAGIAYLTIGNGDNANNTSYIGGASGFVLIGKVTDAGATSEHLRITDTGNVGIGTTSPSTKLEVVSGANEEGISIVDSSSNVKYKVRQFTGYAYSSFYNTSNTEQVRINSNGTSWFNGGNVGIGTTSPSAKLQVDGDVRISGDKYYQMGGSNFKIGADGGGSAMHFYSGGNENMTLNSSGNVGIGTTSPSSKLEVAGTATVNGQLNINGDATSSIRIGTGGTNAALIYSLTGDTLSIGANNATNLVCKTNKDVEFRGNLDLISNGALVMDNANNNNQMYIRNGGSNAAAIQFGHGTVGSSILMALSSDGKLGIGTTAPNASALLDVSSTTKGVLLPRMSTTQINAISSPAEGLTVYNTVLSTLCFFNGVSWQKVTSTAM